MSFTREEYVANCRAVFDYGGGVHRHIDNPDVAEIWVGLTVPEREDLACLFALAEALRRLGEDQRRRREQEEAQRERDRLAKRRAAYAARKMMKGIGEIRAYVLERLVNDHLLADAEFRERLRRLPEPGRRLLLWLLEQQDTEREIQADDGISRREMKTKIAELRRRPVGPLSELEETVIREALDSEDGGVAPGTF